MIRVLMVLGGSMGFGGTEAFLMNYYRHIDKGRVQFDFVFQGDNDGVYDDEIKQYGGLIYHVPFKNRHPSEFTNQLGGIIKNGKYKVVHSQMDTMNWWVLWIAKKNGVKIRISHSHSTKVHAHSIRKNILNNAVKRLIPIFATDLWACSEDAGRWLYGDKLVDEKKVVIINNAIDTRKFQYNKELRNNKRIELGISESTFVVGHCGRLSYQKNHKLLINAFAKVNEIMSDSVLLLVGDGELRDELQAQVRQLGLDGKVIFTGNQRYPYECYNAMDIFVFPSWYEGLSITFLEAQVNGLPCICSDGVTREGCISDAICLSVNDAPDKWAKTIIENRNKGRFDNIERLVEKGFDIEIEAEKLMHRYEALVKSAN